MKSLFHQFAVFISIYGVAVVIVIFALSMAMPSVAVGLKIAISLVLAVGGGVAVSYLLAGGMVKSINYIADMVENADKIASEEEGVIARADEIGNLAQAINRMSSRDNALKQANEDPLTGLANRRYLTAKMEAVFKAEKPLAILFIDLDGFKPINDTHGHEMGDEVLKVIAERYGSCVRDNDVLSRIGGDEFVMMFNGLDDPKVLETRAKRVLELTSEPIWLNDVRLKLGASLGISIAPQDGKTVDEILASADEAMYAAKKGGKNGFRFYS